MANFNGFPKDVFKFWIDLKENNTREWFQDNKEYYVETLQKPAQAFVTALGERLQFEFPHLQASPKLTGGSIMRIYRDVRFSKDKTPYKTNLGVIFWQGNQKRTSNPAFYFHLDAESVGFYCGQWMFPKGTLHTYRAKVAHTAMGKKLAKIEKGLLKQKGFSLTGQKYKRVPRGYDPEHNLSDYLLYKGLWADSPPISRKIAISGNLIETCLAYAKVMRPLFDWLVALDGFVE